VNALRLGQAGRKLHHSAIQERAANLQGRRHACPIGLGHQSFGQAMLQIKALQPGQHSLGSSGLDR